MRLSAASLLALALGVGVCGSIDGRAQQPGTSPPDGRVRSQLTLDSRPVTVAFDPDLRADAAAHRALLSGDRVAGDARVHIGRLESVPLLRIGTLDGSPPEEPAEDADPILAVTYELWLTRDADGWALDAVWVAADGMVADRSSGTIALAEAPSTGTFETLSASVAPTSGETGRIELRWGDRAWTADFHFADPPERSVAAAEQAAPGAEQAAQVLDDSRPFEDDARADLAARFTRLAERNETAIELADGARIAVLVWQDLGIDHPDHAAIGTLADGDVLRLTEAAVNRLRTEVSLRFGDVLIPTGNLSPDFPGSYGIWIQRRGSGWRLVFNNEPDSWGTQHNPEYNAAQTELTYSRTGPTDRPLGARLVPNSSESGQLVIHWGAHQWAADFVVVR